MKVKHSKYKNTGILFELLTRQLTSDTIAGNNPKALDFLKKHFNSKTELLKEYKIYHTLSTKKYSKDSQATMLIEELVKAHNRLNKSGSNTFMIILAVIVSIILILVGLHLSGVYTLPFLK